MVGPQGGEHLERTRGRGEHAQTAVALIGARLEQASSGALTLNMGTLYPGLMRLEQQGLIKAEWGVTDNSRQARFYTVTAAGRRRLAAEKKAWDQMVSVMRTLFEDPA